MRMKKREARGICCNHRHSLNQGRQEILDAFLLNHKLVDYLIEDLARPTQAPRCMGTLILLISAANGCDTSRLHTMLTVRLQQSTLLWQSILDLLALPNQDLLSLRATYCLVCEMSVLSPKLLCHSQTLDIILAILNCMRNKSTLLEAARQTLVAFVQCAVITTGMLNKELNDFLTIVFCEDKVQCDRYPRVAIRLVSALRGSNIEICKSQSSFVLQLLLSQTHFRQAFAIKLALGEICHMSTSYTAKDSRVWVSLMWMLFHSDQLVVKMVATSMKALCDTLVELTHRSTVPDLIGGGGVPILWMARHDDSTGYYRRCSPRSIASNILDCLQRTLDGKKHRPITFQSKYAPVPQQTTNWSCKNSNIALTLLYISSSTPVLLDTLRQLSKSLSSDLQVIRVLCRLLVTLPHYSRNSNADARGPQFNGITVLIRTIQRDAKMMIPPSRLLEKFSLDIPSILRDTYLDQGEVSILWGNYESWECLISLVSCSLDPEDARDTTSSLQTLSPNLVVDALSISCCHRFLLPRHAYLNMLSNSAGDYNSAAGIVLAALKYGAPNLAVDMFSTLMASCGSYSASGVLSVCTAAFFFMWFAHFPFTTTPRSGHVHTSVPTQGGNFDTRG